MTELFLQTEGTAEWQQVQPDTAQSIRLTRENPYFTQSESYTLDVSIPMDIMENRRFFSNIQRMERSKQPQHMKCRLMVDNRPVLTGTARLTQVTERQVKLQLLGGRSEVNFLSEDSGDYIDELPLGHVAVGSSTTDTGVRVGVSPVNDETHDTMSSTWQFCLVDLALQIIRHYGFTVTSCTLDAEPWNRLFVATAKQTREASHTLPHWTPREFFTEFCHFFNVTLDIDEVQHTVAITGTPDFFASRPRVQLEPVDEYTAEINNDSDSHALANDSIAFDLSGSSAHDYDCFPDNVREGITKVSYDSLQVAREAYDAMTDAQRRRTLFVTPVGAFTAWDHDRSDWGEQQLTDFTQMDVLAPLNRDGGTGETKLKICPAAITMGEYEAKFGSGSNAHTRTTRLFLPSVESPTPNDTYIYIVDGRVYSGPRGADGSTEQEGATIQELITGEDEPEEKEEKEDRLQVIFIDDVPQTYSRVDSEDPDRYEQLTRIVGFTDWQYKKSHRGSTHRRWSLSLNPTDADHYLGQLHANGFSFNMKARHTFRFVAERMPDPRNVFIVRGKRYGCEKIEASITADGFDRLMTGYFHEITEEHQALPSGGGGYGTAIEETWE